MADAADDIFAVATLGIGPMLLDAMSPDMPDIPDPGAVPSAEEALQRRRLRERRDRASLRIDPAAESSTGLQIPGS
jgi:hypothetical protein